MVGMTRIPTVRESGLLAVGGPFGLGDEGYAEDAEDEPDGEDEHGRGLVVVGIIIVDETEDDNAEDEEKRERVKRKAHEKRPFRAGSSMARRVARAAGSRRPFSMASMAARA